jgi:hypothetical protein
MNGTFVYLLVINHSTHVALDFLDRVKLFLGNMTLFPHFHSPINLLEQPGKSFVASLVRHEEVPGIAHKVPILPHNFWLGWVDYPWGRINHWLFMMPTDPEP